MKSHLKKTISDQSVKENSGKVWAEWFKIIDRTGGLELSHKEIVAFLKTNYQLSPWWQQMVTVTYEQQTGRREKHQKSDGFQISKSKTFNQPPAILQDAWSKTELCRQWLPHTLENIPRLRQSKSLRMNWIDGKTTVEIQFFPKGETKTQLTVQHSKIASLKKAEQFKMYWQQQLNKLESILDQNKLKT
jgi:uncharacterized protein YndB with AHSA1/START domain